MDKAERKETKKMLKDAVNYLTSIDLDTISDIQVDTENNTFETRFEITVDISKHKDSEDEVR